MDKNKKLLWDSWNIEHIKKHNVSVEEVEEAYRSNTFERTSYANRIKIFGKTKLGRFLAIVLSFERQSDPYVVSSRDMNRKEKIFYYVQTETN